MRLGLALLAFSVAVIAAAWAWLGAPQPMPASPLAAGEKLYCLSYAPFRGTLTPFDPTTQIPASQIEEDLMQLAKLTDCVRVYSVDQGLEHVPAIAARLGLKVLQGFWISADPEKTRIQLEAAVDMANRYPETIRAVVVGNEVLLRGEMSAADLAATIRAVKARVKVPVTYADVWEFWLRAPDVAAAVDFITIHILPYWEDFPIAAGQAAAHVDAIRRKVADAFPGKEVIIGEMGWPSAGRMREGALPSPANQARVIQDVVALAQRDKFHVNVIEAYDQPWKRALEGTVGGHWGLIDDAHRNPKFTWGEPVSDHPHWKVQAAGGAAFAVLVFGAVFMAGRRKEPMPPQRWLAVTACAIAGGLTIGWTIANVPIESLGWAGWSRSLAFLAVAILAPVAVALGVARNRPLPRISRLLGPAAERSRDPLTVLIGVVVVATLLLSVVVALGLVFDPRYRDFPFAPLTAAVLPMLAHSLAMPRPSGRLGAAEIGGAVILALSAPYIVLNEGIANWQALWVCAMLVALAVTLLRVRDARS